MSAITHREPVRNEPPLKRSRILIVGDDSYGREVIAQYLELKSYEVEQAADGEQALVMASVHAPDLVVLDLMLPGMDGFEVATRLRAINAAPILALTRRSDEADELAARGLGAAECMSKPFRPRELVSRVRAMTRFDQ